MSTKKAISNIMAVALILIIIGAAVGVVYYFLILAPPAEEREVFRAAYVDPAPATSVFYLAHFNGMSKIAEELNSTENLIEVDFFPDTPIPDEPALLQSLSEQGYDLIVTGSQIIQWVLDNGANYPDTQFVVVTARFTPTENVGTLNIGVRAGYYAAGAIAAHASQTGKIGFISAFELALLAGWYNAYRLGAESVNSNIEVLHIAANSWFDPTVGASAVDGLIMAGADAIAACGDGMATGAIIHAEEKGIYSFGYLSDMKESAPNAVLASVVWDSDSTYRLIFTAALAGGLRGSNWELEMHEGSTKIVLNEPLIQSVLTTDQIANMTATIEGLESGEIYVPTIEVYP